MRILITGAFTGFSDQKIKNLLLRQYNETEAIKL
jgi:hypothetical protein